MTRPLMTAEDVTRRLAAGEDPLELSIEKWEILVERWGDEDVDILKDVDKNEAIGPSTCALCIDSGYWEDRYDHCERCSYCLHYEHECFEYHYKDVEDILNDYERNFCDRSEVVSVAKAMLDALKEIRNIHD